MKTNENASLKWRVLVSCGTCHEQWEHYFVYVLGEGSRDRLVAIDGDIGWVETAGEIAAPGREAPAGGGHGRELDHVAIVIRAGIVAGDGAAAHDRGCQAEGVLGEGGRDRLVAIDGDIGWVEAAGEVATPGREAPAGGGHGRELDHIAVVIGAGIVAGDAATAHDRGRQGVSVLDEGSRDGLVAIDGDIGWAEAAGEVTAPGREAPAGDGHGRELDHVAVVIGAGVVAGNAATAHDRGCQGVGVLGEGGRDRLVAIDGDIGWVEAAGEIAAPGREAPAGEGHGRELDHIAVVVIGAGVVAGDAAAAHNRGRQGVYVLGEGGRDGLVAIDGDIGWAEAAGEIAAPGGEAPAGEGHGRELDHVAVVIGAGVVAGDAAAAHDSGRQGVGVLGEGSRDRLVAIDGDIGWVEAAGEIAAPGGEAPAGGGHGRELDHVAVVIGAGIVAGDGAAAHDGGRQGVGVLGEGGRDRLVAIDGDIGWVEAAGEIAAPGGEAPAGGGHGRELDHVAVVIGAGVVAGDAAAAHDRGRQGVNVLGEGGRDRLVAIDGDIGWVEAAGEIAAPGGEAPAGGGHGRELDHVAVVIGAGVVAGDGATAHDRGRQGVSVLGEGGRDRLVAIDGDIGWVEAAGEITAPGGEAPAGGGYGRELDHIAVVIGAGVVAGDAAAAHDRGRQGVSVLGEGGRDRLVAIDGDIGWVEAAGEIAAPGGEAPAGERARP